MLELLTEEHYTKSRVAQSGLAILLLVLFAGLLLTLQNVFAEKKVESMGYEYVVCDNGVWYPTGTDCKVALKQYREQWGITDEEEESNDDDKKPLQIKNLTPQVSPAPNKDLREDEDVKEVCAEVGGKMTKDGCETDHDGPMADKFEELMTERNQEEVKPTLLVPDEFEGTLTEEQKEALSKENPNWEFSKSHEYIPNSLEGTETQEQKDALAKAGIEWEYEWEDTDSNPIPGTPSYVEPEEEEKRYVNPDGGSPLYEDELTEEEKDYYEEYKPEKEEKQIEDWRNTVSNDDENEITSEEAESSDNEETQQADEQVEEQEDEPEEEEDDNSDSESEE